MTDQPLDTGLADRELAMPGPDYRERERKMLAEAMQRTIDRSSPEVRAACGGSPTPDADLGELARPFAVRWFGETHQAEWCVGAIRDFVLSNTFREWYKGVGR